MGAGPAASFQGPKDPTPLSLSAVARLEAGNVSPSLPTLDKLADALGVELVVGFVDLDDRIAG